MYRHYRAAGGVHDGGATTAAATNGSGGLARLRFCGGAMGVARIRTVARAGRARGGRAWLLIDGVAVRRASVADNQSHSRAN